jgi:hypothetical protein
MNDLTDIWGYIVSHPTEAIEVYGMSCLAIYALYLQFVTKGQQY